MVSGNTADIRNGNIRTLKPFILPIARILLSARPAVAEVREPRSAVCESVIPFYFIHACGRLESTHSGSTSLGGVSVAAAAMLAFIPVLSCLVQCNHECANAVVNSVVVVARLISFISFVS